ncbi:MAG: extracellular solute-binding protein [Chloroflexi bacterium]|nr:extracellular solute-binding protein [Chloroflexota bacterium]
MKRLSVLVIFVLVTTILYAACTPTPASAPPAGATTPAPARPAIKATWEQEWTDVQEAARREGTVVFYGIWLPAVRTALTAAAREKLGIEAQFTPFSNGAEMAAKVQTETRAGIYFADLYGAGLAPLTAMMKPNGLLGPIEPFLILPEVKDPKFWTGGQFPFIDKDRTLIGMSAQRTANIVYSTDLLKRGEISDYKDVLKPQYKGKIIMDDPLSGSLGTTLVSHLAVNLWNLDQAKDFLRQLVKQQGVVFERDRRILIESVARGKYAIGLAPDPAVVIDMMKVGAQIDMFKGSLVTQGQGIVSVPTKPAHPNAARAFINWLLTREGQTVFSQNYGMPSIRTDVTTEGIHPLLVIGPEEKPFFDTEEHSIFRGKMLDVVKEVLQEAAK